MLELTWFQLVSYPMQETLSKILTVQATPLANSTTLVMSVLEQVKLVPERLETFIEVLQKSIDKSTFQSKSFVYTS